MKLVRRVAFFSISVSMRRTYKICFSKMLGDAYDEYRMIPVWLGGLHGRKILFFVFGGDRTDAVDSPRSTKGKAGSLLMGL